MPSYAWSCLACGAGNAPSVTACARCGCAASANLAQIEAARRTHPQPGPARAPSFDIVETLKAFHALPIAGGVLGLLGVVALLASTGDTLTAFGGLLLALAALCVSSYRPR